ncbi:Asp-tRNA(Asn)/Glu-tRNA(Gln) amidotransferase subunit GatA [Patescibacteria group bacterium]
MAELCDLTIKELSGDLKSRKISAQEVAKSVVDRMKTTEKDVDAYLDTYEDEALAEAEKLDKKADFNHELYGIPCSIKDALLIKGKKTTAASKVLENYIAPYTATSVQNLIDKGAVITGKTNMDEFAMGSSTEVSAYKVTKNPWDLKRVPGGTSGGATASVAAGSSIYGIGSDTGGSIRQPASFCSVTGLKPTYGMVSRYGLIAHASGFDQVSVAARSVEDAAIVLTGIAGRDQKDATSFSGRYRNLQKSMKEPMKGMKIGVPKEYFDEGLDDEVRKSVEQGIMQMKQLGATISDVSLSLTKYSLPAYYILVSAEASSNLARYDGIRYGERNEEAQDLLETYMKTRSDKLGIEVKRRILMGTYVLSAGYKDAFYKKAQQVRSLIKDEFEHMFSQVDLVVGPASPVPPFKIHERTSDPLSMYLMDVYTGQANLIGSPAMSVPCGFTKEGLPIGLQFTANKFDEGKILRAGYWYQQDTDWHKQKPQLIQE